MGEFKNNKPTVSVFVPSYNHAPFVERCLISIIKQTHVPSELLVIDDGSKDDSSKVIERVLKDCPFPSELIVRSNKGLCATLNEGFDGTSGDYFAYLGSDDVWFPDFLRARVELLESRPNAVLGYGHAYLIDEEDNVIESSADWNNYSDGDARPMLMRGLAPVSSTVCYRRSALEKHHWNEEAHLEDFELYLHLSHEGLFAFDPSVLSAWRLHKKNTSHDLNMMLQECLTAHRRVARALGMTSEDLGRAIAETSLQYALFFARKHDRAKALSLLLHNWTKAPSFDRAARILFHCTLPKPLAKWRKGRKKQTSTVRLAI